MSHPLLSIPCTLLILCLLPQSAAALDMDIRTSPADYLDFALWISNNETTLKDRNQSTRIKYQRIGVSTFTVSPEPVQMGLYLGYAFTNEDDIAATQGMNLNGYYLGLGMRAPLLEQERLQLRLEADYVYQQVDDGTDTQNVKLNWNEVDAGVLMTVPLGYVQLLAGLYYQHFDATQTASGTIQQTLFLENDTTLQQRIGINYNVAPGEHVGLHYHSGASRGVQLKFQKLF